MAGGHISQYRDCWGPLSTWWSLTQNSEDEGKAQWEPYQPELEWPMPAPRASSGRNSIASVEKKHCPGPRAAQGSLNISPSVCKAVPGQDHAGPPNNFISF